MSPILKGPGALDEKEATIPIEMDCPPVFSPASHDEVGRETSYLGSNQPGDASESQSIASWNKCVLTNAGGCGGIGGG